MPCQPDYRCRCKDFRLYGANGAGVEGQRPTVPVLDVSYAGSASGAYGTGFSYLAVCG